MLSVMLVQFAATSLVQETLPPLGDALPPQNYENSGQAMIRERSHWM